MWFKISQSVFKELKLLFRDFGGLIILFLMPVVLVVVVTSIQDSTFQSIGASKIPVLWIDHDQDSVSFQIKKELEELGNFALIDQVNQKKIDEKTAQTEVFKGNYQMAIVVPEKLTSDLDIKVRQNVDAMLEEMGFGTSSFAGIKIESKEIQLFF
ncbi:MAG TPA: ABC transporter permease, partial [Flavobacterium sp.]|nr:ABC transporter permease [Flavobacterium sp.]